jgi:hypothetical protein
MTHVSFKGDVIDLFWYLCKNGQTMAHMPNLSLKTKVAVFNGRKVSDNCTRNSVNLDYFGVMLTLWNAIMHL